MHNILQPALSKNLLSLASQPAVNIDNDVHSPRVYFSHTDIKVISQMPGFLLLDPHVVRVTSELV